MDNTKKLSRRGLLKLGAGSIAAGLIGCSKGTEKQSSKKGAQVQSKMDIADAIIQGGTIVTMDPSMPRAQALAIKDGQIMAIGKQEEIGKLKGPETKITDLKGGLATPGLVDAHGHIVSLGKSLEEVNLRGAESIDEIIERIKKHDTGRMWIRGRGWDQNLWTEKKMPTHHALSEAFPDQPVWLSRVDGHAGLGNAALLDISKIDAKTKAPQGGEILKDEQGEPTGVLVDAAMDLVSPPKPSDGDIKRRILSAQKHLLERGITGAHDMGVSSREDAIYRKLASSTNENEQLDIRILSYAEHTWFFEELLTKAREEQKGKTKYSLAGVKLFADGALGSRGAYMLSPYSDREGHLGLLIHKPEELADMCVKAMAAGWQVVTHAIGDGGNRVTLDAYAKAIEISKKKDHRFRVEHCQIMSPEDIPRFGKLNVIASMQPTHATSDMSWVETRVGKSRLPGAYAWRTFLNTGAHLCFGSDFPVEEADITFGLYSSVTRQDPSGEPKEGWLPDQKLTLEEAIRAFSSEPAYASRREGHLGMLKKGFQADITCFKENIFEIPKEKLRSTPILATIVSGKTLYEA